MTSSSNELPAGNSQVLTPGMLLVLIGILVVATVSSDAQLANSDVSRVENGSSPRDGHRVIQLEEVWRIGDDDDDPLLGVVTQVRGGDDGVIYLLDAQLGQVLALNSAGELVQTYFSEGEGPGQVRRPGDFFLMPGGNLGIVQRIPGKIILVDRGGNPAGVIIPGAEDPVAGGFWVLTEAYNRGGTLVICGEENSQGRMTQFVALCNPDGTENRRLLTRQRNIDIREPLYVEKDEDFVTRGRWTIGPGGRIFLAQQRDQYEVSIYSPEGHLEQVITRAFTPRPRTAEQKKRRADSLVMWIDGRRVQIDSVIEDDFPAILEIQVMDSGDLWVLSSRGTLDQPDGILQTYDVFDAQGAFRETIAVACSGNPEEDRLFKVGHNSFVLIRQYHSAVAAMHGTGGAGEDGDAEPLSVSLLQLAP